MHPVDDLEGRVDRLAFLHCDDAVFLHAVDRVGQEIPNERVLVRRDRADVGDVLFLADFLGLLLEILDHELHGRVDPGLEQDGVASVCHISQTLTIDRLGEDRGRRRAVARHIVGFRGDLVDELRSHVLERIGELDLLGDRDAVAGHRGAAEGALEDHVAPAGPSVTFTERASFWMPVLIFCRAFSSNISCFAMDMWVS